MARATTAVPPIKHAYLISYDLRQPLRDYDTLYRMLKHLKAKRVLDSVWLLVHRWHIDTLFQALQQVLDADDGLFIIVVDPRTAMRRSQNTELDGQKG